MSRLSLELAFTHRAIPAREVWHLLRESHADIAHSTRCAVDGTACSIADVDSAIAASGRDHFVVEVDDGEFGYGHAGAYALSLVHIQRCIPDEADADVWVAPFLGLKSFLEGRLYEEEYDFWQNAADPLQYEAKGRPYAHLSMRSNGAPPPLEQLVIDVSANPGRRILRPGVLEAVGAVMWLGQSFWSSTGAKKDLACARDWLHCQELHGGVVRIRAAATPFMSATGEEGQVQERLRDLLFPITSSNAEEPETG